jgi:phospho-N-acetylmuramoyl-pentapeptide-transferase
MLQLAVSALYLYLLYLEGSLTCALYIPFTNITLTIHPMVYIFFSMFVIVGCVNAVNLTDGVDGLSSSVTVPVMVFFTVIAVALKRFDLALLPAVLVGGLVAYLFYNWHPAKVFMGDTGSLFLGAIVVALSFMLDNVLIVLIYGFVFVIEAASDIIQVVFFKLSNGKRLFKMAPLHHHFEKKGWSETRVVTVFMLINLAFCGVALLGLGNL